MREIKKTISLLIVLFCSAAYCFAGQISIQMIQHDDGIDEVTEQTYVIEDNLLNGFFDDGYIVTNSPAEVSDSAGQDEVCYKKGLGEAFNGFSDYFVQVKVYYIREGSRDVNKANLEKVDWSVASAKTGVTIKNSSIKNKNTGNMQDDLDILSSHLLSEIKKAIKA